MSELATDSAFTVVEVMEDEDGEVGWAAGHVDPALMVLSTVIERMQNVGADEARDMLLGGPSNYSSSGRRWEFHDQQGVANAMLASVRHVWMVEDEANEEIMHNANEGDPGARPYTRVDLAGPL